MTWVERNTIDLLIDKLPFSHDDNVDFFDFSRLRVKLPHKKSYHDFGALCFSERRRKEPHPSCKGYTTWQVKLNTFHKERKIIIQRFSEFIYSLYAMGKSSITIENYFLVFIGFIQWCDKKYPHAFLKEKNIREAYFLYTQKLHEEVRQNKQHVNSAAIKSRLITTMINALFEENKGSLTAGIKKIRRNKFAANTTAPPSEVVAQQAIFLYTHLFTGISNFILKFNHYPFKLKLPEEFVWVFPGQISFATQSTLDNQHKLKKGHGGWDYKNGVIFNYKMMIGFCKNPASARITVTNAKNILESANQDCHHTSRLTLCSLAIQCFTMLFIANTGMNITPLSQLKWESDNDFEIKKDAIQGFRAVKHRANGTIVEFHITNHFAPYFQQYLKLRKWILQGIEAPLFFTLDKKRKPRMINASLAFKLRMKLEKFNIKVPSAREWRAYKSDWLIRTTDVATAALLLQNSEEIVLRHYATGSKIRADQEMTAYLAKLHEKVIKPGVMAMKDISVGQCKEYRAPVSNELTYSIKPDCTQPEGCLFCTKYYIHADEKDIRKLCSCLYVITETRILADSEIHFKTVFGAVIKRISFLLEAISSKSITLKKMVERIQHEVVEEEKLTCYWAAKLQMLLDLEMI